jgi:hypothetical protein
MQYAEMPANSAAAIVMTMEFVMLVSGIDDEDDRSSDVDTIDALFMIKVVTKGMPNNKNTIDTDKQSLKYNLGER